MEEISDTIVPLGSLALLFAVMSILVFLRKARIARKADESIKIEWTQKEMKRTNLLKNKKNV